ncbi:hypothetical protein HDU84_001882 [Entophlyctis sp. JEL0112]|nr:hypothetical protein HDU84_001882 [Entophlyctis sp. JEL0112]
MPTALPFDPASVAPNTLLPLYAAFLAAFHHQALPLVMERMRDREKGPCKIQDHLARFDQPPTFEGRSFHIFDFFVLVSSLGGFANIKSWTDVCRRVGMNPAKSNISTRMREWAEKHHIIAFFDFLLGIPNDFYTPLPDSVIVGPRLVVKDGFEEPVLETEDEMWLRLYGLDGGLTVFPKPKPPPIVVPIAPPPQPPPAPQFQQQQLPASPFAATPSSTPHPADMSAAPTPSHANVTGVLPAAPSVQQVKRRKLGNADSDLFVVTDGSGEALFALTPAEDAVVRAVNARLGQPAVGYMRARPIIMRVESGTDASAVYVASAAKRLCALRTAYAALLQQQKSGQKVEHKPDDAVAGDDDPAEVPAKGEPSAGTSTANGATDSNGDDDASAMEILAMMAAGKVDDKPAVLGAAASGAASGATGDSTDKSALVGKEREKALESLREENSVLKEGMSELRALLRSQQSVLESVRKRAAAALSP